MNTPALPLVLFLASLLGSLSTAQVTTDSIPIGGPGSCSGSGFNNPGLLNDGVTAASATYVFTLDTAANTLTVVVTNTSPVLVGVPNPLLTDLFFNTPSQVTGVSIVSQTSSAGVAPSYVLTFDADRTTNPNPNGTGSFGAFSVGLSDTGSIAGTIANPNADTYTMPAASLAISPCTFTLSLTGTLTGLTADNFTALLSAIPPGSKPSHAVAKFQAGGVAGASDFINDGQTCPAAATSVVLGTACGGTLAISPPVPGGFSTATYNGMTPMAPALIMFSQAGGTPFSFHGCTMFVKVPTVVGVITATDVNGDFQISSFIRPTTHMCAEQLVLQAMVLDPNPPGRVVEISNGVLVTMGS